MKRTGESELFTFIISDVFSLKWFDWPKVSFEQAISIVSTFTADRIGSFLFGPVRFSSVRISSVRFGSVRITSDRFGSVLAGS
jgi:hypothetical protein